MARLATVKNIQTEPGTSTEEHRYGAQPVAHVPRRRSQDRAGGQADDGRTERGRHRRSPGDQEVGREEDEPDVHRGGEGAGEQSAGHDGRALTPGQSDDVRQRQS
jgi:hypothetical protein